MPKKKFIDRKNAVTFHLVHRSLKDPLAEDESAPQRVLVPSAPPDKDKKKQLEDQQKFGVYYDDDYNYLQHLREVDNTMEWVKTESEVKPQAKIQLPSSVFASKVEDDANLLNKSGYSGSGVPMDEDVVAAMEDDFDFNDPDNELEDNFLELANQEGDARNLDIINEEDESDEDLTYSEGDTMSDEASFPDNDSRVQKKQTTYDILTSTVRNRNPNLRFIDAECEKLLADWDADEEEDNEQLMSNETLLKYCEDYLEGQPKVLLDRDDSTIETTKRLAQQLGSLSDEEYEEIEIPVKEGWSCASINGTNSTCNQPRSIPVPRNLTKKKQKSTTLSQHNQENDSSESDESDSFETESIASRVSVLSIRPKNETPDEKRERKKNLKEFRSERRKEKKVHKLAFKQEYIRQVQMDHAKRSNTAGKKIL